MKNWEEDDGTELCTAPRDFDDARQVADAIGIELLTANFSAEYWERVFEEFLSEFNNIKVTTRSKVVSKSINHITKVTTTLLLVR